MSSSSGIYPATPENRAAYYKKLDETPEQKPKIEMNDQTTRNIEIIWDSINDLAPLWRGEKDMHMPNHQINRKDDWAVFAQKKGHQTLSVLVEFIKKTDGNGKVAIDLGCGNSPAVPLLIEKGWRVIAVDNVAKALAILVNENRAAYERHQLTVIDADVTTFTPEEPVDLVIAADVLPYIAPDKFQATWTKIHDMFIKPNGFFIGSLFRSVPFTTIELKRVVNATIENGAWLLPDQRMVRPLLTHMNYEVQACQYRNNLPGPIQMCIQFVAKKL